MGCLWYFLLALDIAWHVRRATKRKFPQSKKYSRRVEHQISITGYWLATESHFKVSLENCIAVGRNLGYSATAITVGGEG